VLNYTSKCFCMIARSILRHILSVFVCDQHVQRLSQLGMQKKRSLMRVLGEIVIPQ